jgi:hypothetical protein
MAALTKLYMGHCTETPEVKRVSAQINSKIRGYERQDNRMCRETSHNITRDEVVEKLVGSSLSCFYCHHRVTTQYAATDSSEIHSAQWTLDRIDNALPHTNGNTVVACLSCNLRRGTTAHDAFVKNTNGYFSKCVKLDEVT